MPGQRQRLVQTTREAIHASDITRIGKLANMEAQQSEMLRSVRADFYNPASNTFDDFGSGVKDAAYLAINGLTRPPSIDPVAGTFNVTLGAGEGHVVGAGTIPADESEYQVVRWGEQVVAWPLEGQPNPSNPRIGLIVATPADVPIESQSRQILVNPDTRETTPTTVYKLSVPQATISVLVGDAAADPVPPACPAGSLPLFEVVVTAGAADSTGFHFVRRSWRRVEFPGTSQHGILEGCKPNLLGTSQFIPNGIHRLAIDGELLTFGTSKALVLSQDTNHAPGSAPAGNDMATYLYLCGGRHTPTRRQTIDFGAGPAGNYAPVLFVETTTEPDQLGYPKADLAVGGVTFARGACCYVGLKFRNAGATTNCPGYHDRDWFRFMSPCGTPLYFKIFGAKEQPKSSSGSSQAVALASQPAVSTEVEVVGAVAVYGGGLTSATFSANGEVWGVAVADATTGYSTPARLDLQASLAVTTPDASAMLIPTAYNMNVPRLGRP